jgi:membrane fusion protein (multidrug efflux system)
MAAPKKIRIVVLLLVALAALGFGLRWWLHGRFIESTDNAYIRADITSITPRVGGEIVEVAVQNNQRVNKGDLLLRIDSADYEARLANAKASIAQREAALAANTEQQALQLTLVAEARAALAASQAEATRLQREWTRADTLVKEGVASHQRLDTATAANKSAHAQVERSAAGVKAAQQQIAALEADRARIAAELEAAKAGLKLAELDLAATELRAPRDGTVGDLAARLGERVNGGLRLLSIVPLEAVYIEANFKETQLTVMQPGQQVKIEVDAYPSQALVGHVQSVSPASGAEFALLPPDNATGNFNKIVQRVPVKIVFDGFGELAGRLRPGMSVEVEVDTRTGDGASS